MIPLWRNAHNANDERTVPLDDMLKFHPDILPIKFEEGNPITTTKEKIT